MLTIHIAENLFIRQIGEDEFEVTDKPSDDGNNFLYVEEEHVHLVRRLAQ